MNDTVQIRAALKAAILVSLADGKPDFEEVKVLERLIGAHPSFARLESTTELVTEAWRELKEAGMEACIERIATRIVDRPYRELAFRACADTMRADGTTAGEEAMILGELQERFGFSADEVRRLLAPQG